MVKRFIGETGECNTKNDEADVAVFSACVRFGGQWNGECGFKKVIRGMSALEKFFVGRKAGRVSEKHSQSDFATDGIRIG